MLCHLYKNYYNIRIVIVLNRTFSYIYMDGLFSCISGQLVSNKKEELTAILDHFNIQVQTHFHFKKYIFDILFVI